MESKELLEAVKCDFLEKLHNAIIGDNNDSLDYYLKRYRYFNDTLILNKEDIFNEQQESQE
jgi:hypothetical protein